MSGKEFFKVEEGNQAAAPSRPPPPPLPTPRGLWFRSSEAFCTLATASKLRWGLFFFLRSKGLSDIVAVAVTQASAPSP